MSNQLRSGQAVTKVVISIPYARCLKTFLDTPLYREIKARHSIHLVSYLTADPAFREAYGGPKVSFGPRPEIRDKRRRSVFQLMEAFRVLGFLFRWRGQHTRVSWRTLVNASGNERPRPLALRLALVVISLLGHAFRLDALMKAVLGNWILRDDDVDRMFTIERPDILICTAHGSEEETILCRYAMKYKVPSLLAPNTPDAFLFNGFLAHQYEWMCVAGPEDRRFLERLHNVRADRIVNLGIMANRLFAEIARGADPARFRDRLGIPPDRRVIYYLSTTPAYYRDLQPTIDHLLTAIESGALPPAVIVLRAVPTDDLRALKERYGRDPRVRIQVAGPKSLGMVVPVDSSRADEDYLDFVETLQSSAVMVMSGLTSASLHAMLFDVPVVSSIVEVSRYPWWSFSPRAGMQWNDLGMRSRGLPLARTLDELVHSIAASIKDPASGRDARARILRDWDYQNDRYADEVLAILDGVARPAGADTSRSRVRSSS